MSLSTAVLAGTPLYLGAFGLTEPPFSTTPDQRFLYLSERHRDALAHLLYGLAERGGFVQLTGEVGTGKTTLCRHLLDHLPGHVDVALILNPTVTRLELLATICDELRVAYPPEATSVKVLVDALYAHLLEAHAHGRRTVVIVDEAQHLGAEALEQLRLLTNLETGRAKLLQIILIGQPELSELMSRHELRQVAQRVVARYHLVPLTERETRAYVSHRLAVAGQPVLLFDAGAIRAVHRASGGVPRLINVVCDRALLGAYAMRRDRVTAGIVRRAGREIAGEAPRARKRHRWVAAAVIVAATLVVVAGAAAIARTLLASPPRSADPSPPAPVAAALPTPAAAPVPAVASLRALLDDPAAAEADRAYAAIAARWDRTYARRGDERPCDAVRRAGLDCLPRRGTWNVVRRFDLPVVLELASPAGPRFLAVTGADDRHATVRLGARVETVPLEQIEREWDGSFVVLWKPPRVGIAALRLGAAGADVLWLRQRLAAIDGRPAESGSSGRTYDEPLAARVTAFQRAHGLTPDGIAGAETLARLTATLNAAPSLRRATR